MKRWRLFVLLGAVAAAVSPALAPSAGVAGSQAARGTLIAFESFGDTTGGPPGTAYRSGVWVVRSDGSGLRRLTPNSIGAAQPAWSPDGKRIVFVGSPAGDDFAFDLYVMRADGSGLRRLVKLRGGAEAPDWSPDGRTIVFARYGASFLSDIYAVGAHGRGLRRLTGAPGDDTDPAWTPDGRLIAFGSGRLGSFHVYVMNPDGSGQRLLIRKRSGEPAWSPDGRQIAYASARDGDPDIFVANADGSGERVLTRNTAQDFPPTWSPNGRRIAFASNRPAKAREDSQEFDVWVMNADGSGQRRVTRMPGGEWNPAWQPRP